MVVEMARSMPPRHQQLRGWKAIASYLGWSVTYCKGAASGDSVSNPLRMPTYHVGGGALRHVPIVDLPDLERWWAAWKERTGR